MSRTLVVVGNGMVGHRLVRRLRERDPEGRWRVVVFGEEAWPAYDRMGLSERFAGREEFLLPAVPEVDLRVSTAVTAVDRARRTVLTSTGDRTRYDALVLATGSRPFVPPVEGSELGHVYRTLDDLDAIHDALAAGSSGVVVGGGLLGLEAANALRLLGSETHVVETAPWLMPAQLDEGGGRMLNRLVAELGVRVHCGTTTEVIEGSGGRPSAVRLADGTVLKTDLVVFSAGIRPRDELAASAGLALGEHGGFLVDSRCRSADERIWAVGECAAVEGVCHGLVNPGYAMAEAVVEQLLGGDAEFLDADSSTRLKLLDVEVGVFGDTKADGLPAVYTDSRTGTYAKLVVGADRRLRGGILVGDTTGYPALSALVGREPPADPAELLVPR
ncbi:NAD(P)/FAD-dependent oxidoreductase [Actinopolyspora erythraea]|uniref:NAD(P)/FAD-dependent oxidoreductase n=1 Tax=Actinopolyspora erythraea TaxID=414996 RepID=A0A099D6Z1_9ACTN|nr:FAD-dependent oxidoreductase [Actinopolyspora erythraea]ASU79003.1 NAD(P)/FAD-dependent oxidoreductase [Actinopolyspora erythraea]KGI81130.1 nitrite reductase [Actinopolyspora erythraea]